MTRRISISLRLTLWFGGIFLLGWLLFGAGMWMNLRSTLKSERYQTLTRRADRLQDMLSRNQNEAPADRYQDFKDFAYATGNGLSEVFHPDGTRAYPSPSTAAKGFAWPKARGNALSSEQLVHVSSGSQPYWVLVRPFTLAGEPLLLMAAAPESGNLVVLHNFWRGLLGWAPILLLISCAGGYWVSRRALQPVDTITAKARSISIRNLSERLPVAATADELQRLAITCNEMLSRLEASVNQIKQFTADASHELRGPLSFTRTVAEFAMKDPATDARSRQAFEEIVAEVQTSAVLLEDMLTLARADADPYSIALASLDLVSVVEEVCAVAKPIAESRSLSLAFELPSQRPIEILGEYASLRRLVWILLDNSLKYTPAPGRIEISLSRAGADTMLRVSDTGIGIAAGDIPRVFDRFYRADPSRGTVEGNGLGLAIAKWIAETHRAELSVDSVQRLGTTFQLKFGGIVP